MLSYSTENLPRFFEKISDWISIKNVIDIFKNLDML